MVDFYAACCPKESQLLLGRAMCSLEEAFSNFLSDGEGGGGGGLVAGLDEMPRADPERRRKKKRRAALLPPEPAVIEPDRPAHRPPPPPQLLEGSAESAQSAMLNAYDVPNDYFPHPSTDVDTSSVYNLEPDWAKAFNGSSAPDWIKDRMPSRNVETPLIPSPWIDGAPTLWQNVPDGLRTQFNLGGAKQTAEARIDDLQHKLDSMFERLDGMETSRNQNTHLEILLFVLGGLFLLLVIDLLVKQGMQATYMLASAGGGVAANAFLQGGFRGLAWAN